MITFTQQEFQYLQQITNEMFQSATLRTGPMGDMIINIRNKFIVIGTVNLTDPERQFLLFTLNDLFVTSHSSIVKSQLGLSMQTLRPDTEKRVVNQIDQDNPQLSGTFTTQWQIIQSCMTKLGLAPNVPYTPLERGPDGDPGGISTPMHHDINDGTGYNKR